MVLYVGPSGLFYPGMSATIIRETLQAVCIQRTVFSMMKDLETLLQIVVL